MISPNQCRRFTLVTCLLALLTGCADQHDEPEVQLPDWLSETGSATAAAAPEATDDPDATPSPVRNDQSASVAGGAWTGGAAQLQPGERFPLRKIVEQVLTQPSLNGDPQISRSRTELLLTITLADVRDGHSLMQVHYDRVRYSHDVAGERVEYDSAQPSQTIPEAVLIYQEMVGKGFAFWLGPGNQIVQVDGLREFVEGCMAHVPAEERRQALLALEDSAGRQSVADFVDSTIGLLPAEGDELSHGRWEQTRHIVQPVPMQVITTYTLSSLSDRTAEVTIGGTILPSTALGASGPQDAPVQITVNGGSTNGQCTVDRQSGLPRRSQLEQIVDMTVQMDGGIEFAQQKRTLTTIEALPQQRLASADGRAQFR
jgi:hypothetical protein